MTLSTDVLAPDLVERVLLKLGIEDRPEPTVAGLQRVYSAWCRRVPFDNVLKMIQLSANPAGPLPGDDASEFFESWLEHGTGGTCWAGNGALYSLVASLGFPASRGIGTMMSSPNTPPNHGTVVVELDGSRYIVDASILHGEPLRLDENGVTETSHPAWGVQCQKEGDRWRIRWRPFTAPSGIACRVERFEATVTEFSEMHESTRPWSPFNYALSARLIWGDTVVGAGLGRRVTIDAAGGVAEGSFSDPDERARLLIEQIGMSEEIVSRLPSDRETPPPPWAPPTSEPASSREGA